MTLRIKTGVKEGGECPRLLSLGLSGGDDQNIDVYLVEDNFCYGLASLGLSIGDEGAKYEAKSQMGGEHGDPLS